MFSAQTFFFKQPPVSLFPFHSKSDSVWVQKGQNQVFICKCLKEILASLCLFMLIYLKCFCRICLAPHDHIFYIMTGCHSCVSASADKVHL